MTRPSLSDSRRLRERRSGFTLVEMLVAVAVMAMFVVLIAQMVGSASNVTASAKKRLDADDEARLVFDRMEADIAAMVRRPDVDPLFASTSGNDEFYFYSQAPATFAADGLTAQASNSQVALVGYRVTTNGLERLGQGLSWDTLLYNYKPVTTNLVTSSNYHTLAPSVFRMEYALLMKPGSTNVNSVGTGISTNGTNVFFQTNSAGQSLKDVEAIVVGLAILDQTSRLIVRDVTNTLSNVASSMDDASLTPTNSSGMVNGFPSNGIPVPEWTNMALSTALIPPPQARSQIRIYRRVFPIP